MSSSQLVSDSTAQNPLSIITQNVNECIEDIAKANDVQNVEGQNKEDNPILKKSRKRKSKVWEEFSIITKDGIQKAKCNYCDAKLSINAQGSTIQFHRHLDGCAVRMATINIQKLLTTTPLRRQDFGGGLGGTITTYRYDKEKVRECIAKMIIVHEYSFRVVEHEFFILLYKTLNPRFDKMSRITIRNDCLKLYLNEKKNLKAIFADAERFSLTADLWTSNQTIGYMCLTGHFINSEWKLQKRILNFCSLATPHTGVVIADNIFQCLIDWGIENKVSTITLDNASSNDVAVRNLKDNFRVKGKLYFKGKIFHVRCCAHVLNLMVQDGLHEIRDVIENIRESVKYLKMSPSLLHKFAEIVKQLQLPTSRRLILDLPTRWNSTFAMLQFALLFREVFPRYQERDTYYQWLPSLGDWERAQAVSEFLDVFNEATHIFSGTSYPTSNLFLPEIWKIKEILNEKLMDDRDYIRNMTFKMGVKFDKYWGECNLLMAIATVLDPRYKMKLIEFCFPKIYSTLEANKHIELVRSSLYELYDEYAITSYTSSMVSNSDSQVGSSSSNITFSSVKGKTKGRVEFDNLAQRLDTIEPAKSDLDIYLEEWRFIAKGDSEVEFSALDWWKANNLKFRIL